MEARVGAAGLAGQPLAVGIRTLALASGHSCLLRSIPYLILVEKPEKLRLKALLSLAVVPSEVLWTETVGATQRVHTGPPFLAGAVFTAVVFHFLGLHTVSPALVLIKVRGGSTPGLRAWPALVGTFVVQPPVVLEGEVAGLPGDSENDCVLFSFVLMLLGRFPRWNRKC